jgi:hypothetical protein
MIRLRPAELAAGDGRTASFGREGSRRSVRRLIKPDERAAVLRLTADAIYRHSKGRRWVHCLGAGMMRPTL